MSQFTFSCPHCATPLRVRDRHLIGTTISCPDCRLPVQLQFDAQGRVYGLPGETPPTLPHAHRTGIANRPHAASPAPTLSMSALPGPSATIGWWLSPTVVAWSVATVMGTILLGAVVLLPDRTGTPAGEQSPDTTIRDDAGRVAEVPHISAPEHPASVHRAEREADAADGERAGRHPVEERLQGTYARITDQLRAGGTYPPPAIFAPGLPTDGQFSWIAGLVADQDAAGRTPLWELGWRDPQNDRFVRRRRPELLNPLIAADASPDRYPATHFVGVAGLGGVRGPRTADDPGIGVFGLARPARTDDLSDGASQTMLLAGVQQALGSWAAAGSPTVRSFTAEPYINGPDGFGTGQTDGMLVLMADGSVRFLSAEIDAQVFRGLVAMNDGAPVAPSDVQRGDLTDAQASAAAPGQHHRGDAPVPEPVMPVDRAQSAATTPSDTTGTATTPSGTSPPAAGLAVDPAGALPVPGAEVSLARAPAPDALPVLPANGATDPGVLEEQPAFDVAAALRQPIVSFHQHDPIPARTLLLLIEEMAGVPVSTERVTAAAGDSPLDQPVTLSLTKTTVGEILEALLERLDLTYIADESGIYLQHSPRAETTGVETAGDGGTGVAAPPDPMPTATP